MVSCAILQGDALAMLRGLPSNSFHCCVTSPPYWGLRDYGVEGQYGLEASVDLFLDKMVEVFAEVRRVLRPDGTLWLNMGDTYNGQNNRKPGIQKNGSLSYRAGGHKIDVEGLKDKDLVGLPWRVAFALQANGWYLRRDNIWSKPNPMPESVRDRPANSHEYVFLMTREPKYYYDHEGVRQPSTARSSGLKGPTKGHDMPDEKGRTRANLHKIEAEATRNLWSVWPITTQPFKGAHFATFPEKLPAICIQAGTSDGGCCPLCYTPLKRLVERGEPDLEHQQACGGDQNGAYSGTATKNYRKSLAQDASATKARILAGMRERKTVGWDRTCACSLRQHEVEPCVVLDPFCGSGTTGVVARRMRRAFLGIELNPESVEIARNRIGGDVEVLR